MDKDSLLTFTLLFSILPLLSSAFSPKISYFLNCGSSTATTTLQGDKPPRDFVSDSTYLPSTSNSDTLATTSSTSSPLYSTARAFTNQTSYQFMIDSKATYVVRLHFFPFSTQSYNLSAAKFNVSAPQRFELLADFSVSASATAVIKEFLLWVDTDPLVLTFVPNSLAFINAIEVFTAPSNLIDGANPLNINAARQGDYGQLPQQGLETLYRINVGGSLVTPANDTLWRTWVPDDGYLFDQNVLSFKNSTSGAIKYGTDSRWTPEFAPESVYDTARTMAVTPLLVLSNPYFNFNLTWSFRVLPWKTYFIRMHFCDFLFPVRTDELYFDVYIGQLLAYADLQPSLFTDYTPAAAFYVDFVADSADAGLMNVSIGRSNRSTPLTANALLNGLEIMKIGLSLEPSNKKNKSGVPAVILIPSVLGGLVLITLLITVVVFVCRRRRAKPATKPEPSPAASWSPYQPDAGNSAYSLSSKSMDRTTNSASPRVNLDLQISFLEIKFATNNFDEKLVIGSGGFGKVYKGVLRDGTKVAVKRGLPGSRQGYPEFQTEVMVMSRIRHRHLVSLVGYCDDQSEMVLVYEYMEKGSLKSYLYGSDLPCLSWKQRLEICIGAARGLHYLHTGYSHNIIHRDVKSTNILLGEGYLAKVADFGLSRLGPSFGETHVSTEVKGTFGYLDPEYFKVQKLTEKSDVYSFGVLLFEVLCARPVIDPMLSTEQLNLGEWALIWQRGGQLEKIVDPRLAGKINVNSLRKFGETAEKCLAEYGVDRPTIGDVLWNLEYALQLQETELRREPFEDSGTVESQIPVNGVRLAPSTGVADNDNDDDEKALLRTTRMYEGQSGVTASTVFSQLISDDGR